MSSTKGPVLIELDDATVVEPENAPAVPDVMDAPTGQAMQTAAAFAALVVRRAKDALECAVVRAAEQKTRR